MRTPVYRYSTVSPREKARFLAGRLVAKKAEHILVLDLAQEQGLTEAVVIATAGSMRHGQGLADALLEYAREENFEFLRMEGKTPGLWILLDMNDVVVHIFQAETRELFRLDDLWPSAPVLSGPSQENVDPE